jgi:hypothetical protein
MFPKKALCVVRPSALLLLGMSSCDSGPRRMPVSGTVTFKGAPLKEGTITFIPLTTTTQEGAPIADGKFSFPADKGLAPGIYRVSISSIDATTRLDSKKPPGPSGSPGKERIPLEFNERSKVEAKVTETGDNRFDFKIP